MATLPAIGAHAAVHFDTIALSGATGASLGLGPNVEAGTVFDTFTLPYLNQQGHIGFNARLAGPGIDNTNQLGVWASAGGISTVIARTGILGPGPNLGAGITFDNLGASFGNNLLNDNGAVAFLGRVAGPGVTSANSSGFYIHSGGTNAMVTRNGGAVFGPNLEPGVTFSQFQSLQMNRFGAIGFNALLGGTTDNLGIFSNASGTLAAVARTGPSGPGPNLEAGVNFVSFGVPVLNDSGRLAFSALLSGTGITGSNDKGIFTNVGGSIAALARSGIGGPGPNLGGDIRFSSFSIPDMNNAGNVSFVASILGTGVTASNNSGVWSNVGGSLAVVAREGSNGPGPNLGADINFSSFSSAAVINSTNKIAFHAFVTGPGVDGTNNNALFLRTTSGIVPVARTGASGFGPNLGPDVYFRQLGPGDFGGTPVLNAAGDMVFWAPLGGFGANSSNDEGLFLYTGGVIQPIVRKGDLFDIDPGLGVDLRTISQIGFYDIGHAGAGGEDGRGFAFNDAGLITFSLKFTDLTSGVFAANVPEPTGCGLILSGLLLLARRPRFWLKYNGQA